MLSGWTVSMMQTENVSPSLWKRPKIITVGADARLFSAPGNWVERRQTNRIYMTESHQKESGSVFTCFTVSTTRSSMRDLLDYWVSRENEKEASSGPVILKAAVNLCFPSSPNEPLRSEDNDDYYFQLHYFIYCSAILKVPQWLFIRPRPIICSWFPFGRLVIIANPCCLLMNMKVCNLLGEWVSDEITPLVGQVSEFPHDLICGINLCCIKMIR